MNIIINRNGEAEIASARIKGELIPKQFKSAIILFLIAIVMILLFFKYSQIDEDGGYMYLTFGILFLLFSIQAIRVEIKKRTSFKKYLKSFLQDKKLTDTYAVINCDSSFFTYDSPEKYYKISWATFAKYRIYKDSLILSLDEGNRISFIIMRNELSNEQFSELYSLVSKLIQLKK